MNARKQQRYQNAVARNTKHLPSYVKEGRSAEKIKHAIGIRKDDNTLFNKIIDGAVNPAPKSMKGKKEKKS